MKDLSGLIFNEAIRLRLKSALDSNFVDECRLKDLCSASEVLYNRQTFSSTNNTIYLVKLT